MRPVTRRAAWPEDAQNIAPKHRSGWHEAYAGLVPQRCLDDLDAQERVARWRERLARAGDTTTVALHNGRLVGLATVGPREDAPHLPPEELRSRYVVRAMWGHGIGRALVLQVLGQRPASLWVFEGHDPARAFYALAGWQPTGERRLDTWTEIPELRLVRQVGGPDGT